MMTRPQDVTHDNLQERQVGVVGQPRNADDGERAGLGGDDGKRNRPPGNVAVGQKIVAQSSLPFAKTQAKQG